MADHEEQPDRAGLQSSCSFDTLSTSTSTVIAKDIPITSGWRCAVTILDEKKANAHITDIEKGSVSTSATANFPGIATAEELQRHEEVFPLPEMSGSDMYRKLRWGLFSMYRKLFSLITLVNLVAVIVFLVQLKHDNSVATYGNAATAAAANFCVAILIRNEHVVNILFRAACSVPIWFPLIVRRYAAKIYSYGGVHSGCGIAGSVWYLIFAVLVISEFTAGQSDKTALATTTALTLALLVLILVFAHSTMRMRLHNHFESTHRYGGWAAIACLWVQTMFLVSSTVAEAQQKFGIVLVQTPTFWFLAIITLCLIYPWLRLRSRSMRVEVLSPHAARLHFDYTTLSTCHGIRITDAPLKETHAFATIPNPGNNPGFSVLVSNAGDWTDKIISNPPSRIFVKGAPTLGVARVALLFRKVLIVATGSGIGPCLSLLQAYPDYPLRVVWSAQRPQATYGDDIIRAVYRADPNAVIVDTKSTGRGNLLGLAYSLLKESDCEAAVVISNPAVTKKVVFGLEARGIPAYGPIFDS